MLSEPLFHQPLIRVYRLVDGFVARVFHAKKRPKARNQFNVVADRLSYQRPKAHNKLVSILFMEN
jgi:hypothetical protein